MPKIVQLPSWNYEFGIIIARHASFNCALRKPKKNVCNFERFREKETFLKRISAERTFKNCAELKHAYSCKIPKTYENPIASLSLSIGLIRRINPIGNSPTKNGRVKNNTNLEVFFESLSAMDDWFSFCLLLSARRISFTRRKVTIGNRIHGINWKLNSSFF